MPITAPMVTTPVPPTPVIITECMPVSGAICGSATLGAAGGITARPFSTPPRTLTKDGQKPFTQEKSLLQDDWSIIRLRPHSVSTGWMATQLDCTPQSPQPSQTSSLTTTRSSGSGKRPRLRRRRFSAAQVWS